MNTDLLTIRTRLSNYRSSLAGSTFETELHDVSSRRAKRKYAKTQRSPAQDQWLPEHDKFLCQQAALLKRTGKSKRLTSSALNDLLQEFKKEFPESVKSRVALRQRLGKVAASAKDDDAVGAHDKTPERHRESSSPMPMSRPKLRRPQASQRAAANKSPDMSPSKRSTNTASTSRPRRRRGRIVEDSDEEE